MFNDLAPDRTTANGQTWFAVSLLLLEALAALALALGWRTRLATLFCFVLEASLLNRNRMVLIGGDILLVCLLFWALFLPLGARWSVDATLSTAPPPAENQHLVSGLAGLLDPGAVGVFLQRHPEERQDLVA